MNKEKEKQYQHEYYEKNKERLKARHKQWFKENREKWNAYQLKQYHKRKGIDKSNQV